MAAEAGIHDADNLKFKSATINGGTLLDHDISDYLEPGKFRIERPFQVVVLLGHSTAALRGGNRVRFAEAGGETALYMTHAYVPLHEMYRDDMIRDIENLYLTVGNEVGAMVFPVGLAFEEAYRRRPDLQLHMPYDGTHSSLAGTYLAAATVFASPLLTVSDGHSIRLPWPNRRCHIAFPAEGRRTHRARVLRPRLNFSG